MKIQFTLETTPWAWKWPGMLLCRMGRHHYGETLRIITSRGYWEHREEDRRHCERCGERDMDLPLNEMQYGKEPEVKR